MHRNGPKIAVQDEFTTQREQALLRPNRRVRVVPFRATNSTQVDGVRLAATDDVLRPDRDAVRIDRRAAHEDLVPLDAKAEAFARGVEHSAAGTNDVRANTIAR